MIENFPEGVPEVVRDAFVSLHMDNEYLRRLFVSDRISRVWSRLLTQKALRDGVNVTTKDGLITCLSGPTQRAFYSIEELALASFCINVWMFTTRNRDGKIFVPKKAEQDKHAELFERLVNDCGSLKCFFPTPIPLDVENAANTIIKFCKGWSETIKQKENPFLLIRNTSNDERMTLFRSFVQGISKTTEALWGQALIGTITTVGEVLFELDEDPDRVDAVKKICASKRANKKRRLLPPSP